MLKLFFQKKGRFLLKVLQFSDLGRGVQEIIGDLIGRILLFFTAEE
jgi:hypothetical protein